MGRKIVTDEAGRQFLEGDLQLAVGVAERNTFLRVAPPNGVANFPVGPKAPEWVLQSQQRAAAALTGMLDTLGLGSIKSAPGTGPGSPEVVQSVKPPTDSSAWNMDAVETLRERFRTERPGARTDYMVVDEAMRYMEWPNPYLPEIKFASGRNDADEYDEVVNMQGDVVRRDPVADPTTDTSKWTLPSALQPWQDDLVQKMFGGLQVASDSVLRPGDAFVFNPAYMSGQMSTSTGTARWVDDPVTPPAPTPEPPTPGRFRNLDWD